MELTGPMGPQAKSAAPPDDFNPDGFHWRKECRNRSASMTAWLTAHVFVCPDCKTIESDRQWAAKEAKEARKGARKAAQVEWERVD